MTEIGYLCRHGHFVFYEDPHYDGSCGTKRVAGIHVTPDEGMTPWVEDPLREALEDHSAALDRAYQPEGTTA